MADDLVDAWRRAMDANLKYYESWGRLAGDWLRELQNAAAALRPTVNLPAVNVPVVTTPVSTPDDGVSAAPSPATNGVATRAAVVLEGEPLAVASGALLVENHLDHAVTATVVADPFVDSNGVEIAVEFDVLPRSVELPARAAAIVRIHAELPSDAGELHSTLHVPDLPGTSVPVILRPHPDVGE